MRIDKGKTKWKLTPDLTIAVTYTNPWCECEVNEHMLARDSICIPVVSFNDDPSPYKYRKAPTFLTLKDQYAIKLENLANEMQINPLDLARLILEDWLDKNKKI